MVAMLFCLEIAFGVVRVPALLLVAADGDTILRRLENGMFSLAVLETGLETGLVVLGDGPDLLRLACESIVCMDFFAVMVCGVRTRPAADEEDVAFGGVESFLSKGVPLKSKLSLRFN